MSGPPKYAKGLAGGPRGSVPLQHGAEPGLVLRITLGDMSLEDAFQLELRQPSGDETLGDLLETAFSVSPDARSRVVEALDPRLNPDAPEMYEALAELMADWRSGRRQNYG